MARNATDCIFLFIILNLYKHTYSFVQHETTINNYVTDATFCDPIIHLWVSYNNQIKYFWGSTPEIANGINSILAGHFAHYWHLVGNCLESFESVQLFFCFWRNRRLKPNVNVFFYMNPMGYYLVWSTLISSENFQSASKKTILFMN